MLEQILEYELGEPWKLNEKSATAIVPILRPNAPERKYLLIQETDDVKITDTGSIDKAKVKNNTDKPLFARKGTLLKGATQERGVVIGRIIPPQKTRMVEVQCVHASKGIQSGATFFASNYIAPRPVMQSFLHQRSQGATWRAASRSSHALMSMSDMGQAEGVSLPRMDDLVGTLERTQTFKKEIEEALKKVPGDLLNQVGMVIIDVNGIVGLELFNHPDSWSAFSKSITRNYADVIVKEQSGLFEIKMDAVQVAVKAFMEKLVKMPQKLLKDTTYMIQDDEAVGEFTALGTKVIHLIATRKEKGDEREITYPATWYQPMTLAFSTDSDHNHGSSQTYQPLYTTSQSFLGNKASLDLLTELNKRQSTWKDLDENINVSTKTLSKRLKEAKTHGLIAQQPFPNGRKRYSLTPKGKYLLKQQHGK